MEDVGDGVDPGRRCEARPVSFSQPNVSSGRMHHVILVVLGIVR